MGTQWLSICALAGVFLCAGASAAEGPKSLTPEDFDRLHKMIKPQPGEWKFAEIPWAKTVREAREKSAAEGKPLLIWYMVGEPLGQC